MLRDFRRRQFCLAVHVGRLCAVRHVTCALLLPIAYLRFGAIAGVRCARTPRRKTSKPRTYCVRGGGGLWLYSTDGATGCAGEPGGGAPGALAAAALASWTAEFMLRISCGGRG